MKKRIANILYGAVLFMIIFVISGVSDEAIVNIPLIAGLIGITVAMYFTANILSNFGRR